MDNNEKKVISIADVLVFVKGLFLFGLKKIKILAVLGVLGLALGVAYAYVKKPTYTAFLSFLINENETSTLNLSSFAGLAGLGNLSGGSVNEDKLMFLTTSRQILGSTLLSKDQTGQTIADRFIRVYHFEKSFEADTTLRGFKTFKHVSLDSLNYQENKVIDVIIKFIQDSKLLTIEGKKKAGLVAQNAGIVSITFISIDEELSKLFVDHLYETLSTHYINKTIQRHLRNYNLITHRADSIKAILLDKENTGALYVDQNVNIAKMAARVKVERTRKDMEMLNLMYAEVLKNQEVAKFGLENQTPVLQVVDSPTYPLKVKRASKISFGLLGAILFGLGGYMFLLIKYYMKNDRLVV